MDSDFDVIAVLGKRFIDCVIDDFKHHVMKARAIGCVADVHPWTLANSF